MSAIVCDIMRTGRTVGYASFTVRTVMLDVSKLNNSGNALGIMTPEASERTALKENRSTNTGAVVHGKMLYIKDISVHFEASFPPLFKRSVLTEFIIIIPKLIRSKDIR